MGNTTRREPVTSKIPSSPDYKFLNITDFRGIHQTDNPFLAATNTASDCLNVYVDENNALTTRPRIEKILDASNLVQNIIHSYKVNNGIVFQYEKNGLVELCVIDLHGNYTEIIRKASDNIYLPKTKLCVFYDNGSYYVMSDAGYYVAVLEENGYVLSDIKNSEKTYIPNISTAQITEDGIIGELEFELDNVVSNKYKKSYVWDMFSDPGDAKINAIAYENKYLSESAFKTPLDFLSEGEYKHIAIGEKNYITYTDNLLYKWKIVGDDIEDVFKKTEFSNISHVSKTGQMFTTVSYGADSEGTYSEVNVYSTEDFQNKGVVKFYIKNGGPITQTYVTDNGKSVLTLTSNQHQTSTEQYKSYQMWLYTRNDSSESYTSKLLHNWLDYAEKDDLGEFIYPGDVSFYVNSLEDAILLLKSIKQSKVTIITDFSAEIPVVREINCPNLGEHQALTESTIKINGDFSVISYAKSGVVYYHYMASDAQEYKLKEISLSDEYTTTQTEKFALVNSGKNLIYGYVAGRLMGYDAENDKRYVITDDSESLYFVTALADMTILMSSINDYKYSTHAIHYTPSIKPMYTITYKKTKNDFEYGFKNVIRFQNNWWFYGNKNLVYWTVNNDPTYLSIDTKKRLGVDEEPIVDAVLANSSTLALFKKDKWFITTLADAGGVTTEAFIEAKSPIGAIARAGIVSPYKEIPLYVNENGIYGLAQLENVQSSDHVSEMISAYIEPMFRTMRDKDQIFSSTHLYWTYFFVPHEDNTDVCVLDDRTLSWYFWNIPVRLIDAWYLDEKTYLIDAEARVYRFEISDIVKEYSTEYYDDGEKIIPWFWRSQIMSMGTINYSKKLSTTTFIMTDTDETDEYGLNYKFKIFRKLANESNTTTITNKLNYILSVTKKTIIPRFNFLQFELSNIDEDKSNNKLRLIGLGLKYELLAGLM